jgi:uncharacterized protein YecE (DUF72 family)
LSEGRIRIGTSGWSYDHWANVFYPEHLQPARRLEFLSSRFDTVEIDSTFYHLPTEHAVSAWHATVPDDFVFAVKGSRLITHFRRLANTEAAVQAFMDRVSLLAEKLGIVLWQLPPNLSVDNVLLDRFLSQLPAGGVRHAVEFRHESWLNPETFGILTDHAAAQVHVSSDEMPEDLTPTADFVYVRFHGTSRYHGAYERPALAPWCDFLRSQAAQGRDCYAYFNNDAEGHAPADAERLRGLLGIAGA